ncbi:MAG: DUF3570 domain-containing protein [Methyloglobulus sp.]|nr:DUF3570 domain-containing protein [Methyloglobulus sp.]
MVVIKYSKTVGYASRTDEKRLGFKKRYAKRTLQAPVGEGWGEENATKNPFPYLPIREGSVRVSLHALTTAALVLPGLLSPVSAYATEGDEVDFQYSHYQEGARNISNGDFVANGAVVKLKSANPIEVDSLHGSARVSLTDRVKFAFNYIQDTWGGATPVSTLPEAYAGNNILNQNGITTGASPIVAVGPLFLDAKFNPILGELTGETDPITLEDIYKYTKNTQLSHTMATASPETRKQGDFKLSYDWDTASASVGGGISVENDYESRFGNVGARFDFNQKQTSLNVDLSYTNSDTNAILDHDSYTNTQYLKDDGIVYRELPYGQIDTLKGVVDAKRIQGNRQDWSTHLGLTQVINQDALFSADFSYTRSTGYMANPYKGVSVIFIDPEQQDTAPPNGYVGNLKTLLEQRPGVRNQYNVGGRYVQYIKPLDAALHFDYRFSADDWGIHAHTFEADWVQPVGSGWTVTPRVRYYSQDAANFYTPWLVSEQAFSKTALDGNGNTIAFGSDGKEYSQVFDPNTLALNYLDSKGNLKPASVKIVTDKNVWFDPKKLPANYSSDHRLSGFGTLSGGVTVEKQFAKGVTMDLGFEYYTHQGGLKIGGGGEGSYADFDYWVANAALKVNLEALALGGGSNSKEHAGHEHHNHGVHAPAGVMFDHMLPAGKFMVGYRYMWNSQSGNLLNGTGAVNDAMTKTNGCGGDPCYLAAHSMAMSMHMLDLMYAPTDWLTLMLMPQFTDMNMSMRALDGVRAPDLTTLNLRGHFVHHLQNEHETGGIGDLGMYALFKVFDDGMHHVHATAGLSAPTGDVDIQFRRAHQLDGGFMDYGMQLGSGTWDFKPSLTYTGHINDFSWGAQANGIVRMEDHNKSGYRLGDMFQGTAWGAYNLTNWLTASVRGMYTVQGAIKGQFNGSAGGQFIDHTTTDELGNVNDVNSSILKFAPNDYSQNSGGRYWDVGFGLSAMVPGDGLLGGNRVSVEWLQPVYTDVNGYQLDRDGALSATWSVAF